MKIETMKLRFQFIGSFLIILSLGFILVNFSNIDNIAAYTIPFTIAGVIVIFYSIFIIPSNKKKIIR